MVVVVKDFFIFCIHLVVVVVVARVDNIVSSYLKQCIKAFVVVKNKRLYIHLYTYTMLYIYVVVYSTSMLCYICLCLCICWIYILSVLCVGCEMMVRAERVKNLT